MKANRKRSTLTRGQSKLFDSFMHVVADTSRRIVSVSSATPTLGGFGLPAGRLSACQGFCFIV
jgi:hypothetical protein